MLQFILLAYISGLIVSWIIMRVVTNDKSRQWSDLLVTLVLGLLSWLGVLTLGVIGLVDFIQNLKIDDKPIPNWLKWL